MLCGYCYAFSWLDGVGIARELKFLRTNSGLSLTFITNISGNGCYSGNEKASTTELQRITVVRQNRRAWFFLKKEKLR